MTIDNEDGQCSMCSIDTEPVFEFNIPNIGIIPDRSLRCRNCLNIVLDKARKVKLE
jgi:hypothetical protein